LTLDCGIPEHCGDRKGHRRRAHPPENPEPESNDENCPMMSGRSAIDIMTAMMGTKITPLMTATP